MYDAALAALTVVRRRLYELESSDPKAMPPATPDGQQAAALRAAVEDLFVVQQRVEARVPILAGDREQFATVAPAVILERAAQLGERCRALLNEPKIQAEAFSSALAELEGARLDFLAYAQFALHYQPRAPWWKRAWARVTRQGPAPLRASRSSPLFSDQVTPAARATPLEPVRAPDRLQLPPGRS